MTMLSIILKFICRSQNEKSKASSKNSKSKSSSKSSKRSSSHSKFSSKSDVVEVIECPVGDKLTPTDIPEEEEEHEPGEIIDSDDNKDNGILMGNSNYDKDDSDDVQIIEEDTIAPPLPFSDSNQ